MKISKKNFYIIFILLFALFILINSSFFTVKEIEITGNQNLSEEKIKEELGLEEGISIWDVNLEKLSRKLSPDLLIESVRIQRRLPDKLLVEIKERKGLGWVVDKNYTYLIDKEGFILQKDELDKGGGLNLPLLMGFSSLKIEEGRVCLDNQVQEVLAYLARFEPEKLAAISEVIVDGRKIFFHLVNETEIRTSTERSVEEMAGLINSMWSILLEEDVDYLDLRFKGAPVIKYKNP